MVKIRQQFHINGLVQGVGFRPFIYRIANECNLVGFIKNSSNGVVIEVQGAPAKLELFESRVLSEKPPLSIIKSVKKKEITEKSEFNFQIIETDNSQKASTQISPDVCVCEECLAEMYDPQNRRYNYPFINCTNCGPRYTIVKSIPYDRPFTSMQTFKMCLECQQEYDNPLDRRFHAQPNACPVCGPKLSLLDNTGQNICKGDTIAKTVSLLKNGQILAIRGLGGFHLAVDPFNDSAIERLRENKGRQGKPFALMALDINTIEEFCYINEKEKETLQNFRRPIVLLNKKPSSKISMNIAPANNYFGFMLSYTPLHFLLLRDFKVLVMTSANFTDEPIAIKNEEALERLKDIADYFLIHDREILQRCDDSIIRILKDVERPIRRSRGYVPGPIYLATKTKKSILACGAELKNTIAISRENEVFFSQHIGDLDNPAAYRFFEDSIVHLQDILQLQPEVIACDMHPEYLSTKWAIKQEIPFIKVQHHHAHLASVMAENSINQKTIGIILDGTGYGLDETIWGGEVLVGDFKKFERFAWLKPVAMPGGASAIKEPWRMALSFLHEVSNGNLFNFENPFIRSFPLKQIELISSMIEKSINSPLTSSCGRLFDAVAALLGICNVSTYEAQAAIELEMVVDAETFEHYNEVVEILSNVKNALDIAALIKALLNDISHSVSIPVISARFHNTVAQIFVNNAILARKETGINQVALSGGVFQNVYFFKKITEKLRQEAFEVFTHSFVPTNDGGIALGQVLIANEQI